MDAQEIRGADFEKKQVIGFCTLKKEVFPLLEKDLGLSLGTERLAVCQRHFATREKREPLVGELFFLDRVAALQDSSPAALYAKHEAPTTDAPDEALLAWRDAEAKWHELGKKGSLTLSQLSGLSGEYLLRCGVFPAFDNFACGLPFEIAALCGGEAPALALCHEGLSAALLPRTQRSHTWANILMMLSPTGEDFEAEVTAFLKEYAALGIRPVATPDDAGILPALFRLPGVVIDTALLPDFHIEAGIASLADVGAGTLLFLAPRSAAPALFSSGARLSLIGTVKHTGRIEVQHGTSKLLSLPLSLTRAMCVAHPFPHSASDGASDKAPTFSFAEGKDAILGAVTLTGGEALSLLSFFTRAKELGARLERSTAAMALELPLGNDPRALGNANRLLLTAHRALLELTLPAVKNRIILKKDLDTPRLTLFLAAKKEAPCTLSTPTDWGEARRLFYPFTNNL